MSSAPPPGACEPANGDARPRSPAWLRRLIDTKEAWVQLRFAVPMVLTNMSYYSIPLVSVMFSGHLGNVQLAGATLVNSWATVTGYAFVCLLRYLQTQSVVVPLVVCSMVPFALHVPLNHLLVNVLGFGLAGASAAISTTFWFSCLMLLGYVMWSKKFSETWNGFPADAFKHVLPTIKLAAPSAIMVCLEYWAFELLVLIAGLLPNSTVSTSLIAMCSSTEAIAYMITYGFSAAVSTRVSNEIGAGNVDMAKNAVAVTLKLSVFLAFSFILLLGFGHGLWARLFTGSEVIAAEFAAITPLVMISIVLDSAQGVLSEPSRGERNKGGRRCPK